MSLYPDIVIRFCTRYRIKLRYRIHIACTKRVVIVLEYRTRYRRFLFDIDTIEYTKRIFLECPQYRTRYRIRYRIWNIIFSSKTGASVPRRLIAMKIVKWTLTITVITWTKIFLLGTESAVPCCPIWTHNTFLEWYARLHGHDYRRP